MVAKIRPSVQSQTVEPTEPMGDGGPLEAASFIAEAASELGAMARRHRLETLGFLLDMARLEAEEFARPQIVASHG